MLLANYIDISAQEKNISIILKGGSSVYNASLHDVGGNGSSYIFWKSGPQFTAGIEKTIDPFTFQILAGYSIYGFDESFAWGEKMNNAKNSVYDLMGNLKLNIGIFYFLGGIGFSYQNGEEVRYLESNQFHKAETLYAGKNKFVLAGLIGAGFDIKIYRQTNLIIEADINLREYMGTALLAGIKYEL